MMVNTYYCVIAGIRRGRLTNSLCTCVMLREDKIRFDKIKCTQATNCLHYT